MALARESHYTQECGAFTGAACSQWLIDWCGKNKDPAPFPQSEPILKSYPRPKTFHGVYEGLCCECTAC